MELSSILLILSLLVLTVVFIGQPFFQRQTKKINKSNPRLTPEEIQLDHNRSTLLAEKERCLAAIQELDFDHSLHKIPEDLYPIQRAELMQTAARVLQQLDAIESKSKQQSTVPGELIRGKDKEYDDLEELIAKRKVDQNKKSSGFCPKCGKPVLESDRFCPKCGTTIKTG